MSVCCFEYFECNEEGMALLPISHEWDQWIALEGSVAMARVFGRYISWNKITKHIKLFGEVKDQYLGLPEYFHIFSKFIPGDISPTKASHRNTT